MSVFRVTSFRAAFGFTLVLSLIVALVLGALYGRIEARLMAGEETRIWREAASLTRAYAQGGVRGLAEAVTAQAQAGQGLALQLSNRLGVYLAGNITRFPAPEATDNQRDGWFDFTTRDGVYRARLMPVDDDLILLLGYARADLDAGLKDMRQLFALSLLGLIFTGLIGAALLARRNLARVAAINLALQPVRDGYLSLRLPVERSAGEWALLAGHINTMLERLEKQVNATRQVSDNLAHDLRAPLTRLKMRLEAVMKSADDSQLDQLGDALGDIDGLLRSFNALLALSRLESGTMKLTRQPIDMASLLANLHDLFEAVFDAQAMRLEVDAAPINGFTGDEALLTQSLVNALENILAHGARPDTKAVLALRDAGDMIEVSVSDEGAGIEDKDRARAIERFVRLDESRNGDGSGLGLSLMAAICHHHGGTLELQDNAPGLRLFMRLPKTGARVA